MRILVAVATALLALAVPALGSAQTFTGSISVNALPAAPAYGALSVTATASVSETCDPSYANGPPFVYCGWFPYVTTVDASQPCATTGSGGGWVGSVFDNTSGPGDHTLSPSWSEYPSLASGARTACLYASSNSTDNLIAQAAYTVPAPAPSVPIPAPVATVRDYDCSHFRYQQDAQVYLLAGDPYRLDADHDGIACEELPSRPTYTAPAPTGQQPVRVLDYAEAVQVTRGALARKFGRTWKDGRGRVVSCPTRISITAMACRASWKRRGFRYRASVTVREYSTTYGTSTRLTSKRRA